MPQERALEETLRGILARREAKSQLRRLTTVPLNCVDFSSNAYLSLSTRADVQREYLQRLQSEIGSSTVQERADGANAILGSGGSRLLDGNSAFAEALEHEVAQFHGAKAGLLFNSGFDANVGLFSCVPQPGDVIVYDELIHASVHDGMRMSRASRRIPFAHNSVEAQTRDPDTPQTNPSLSTVLATLLQESEDVQSGGKNVFIAVEGIYSMDGDVSPLGEIVECVDALLPNGNGYIIVDEAHSTGVIGDRGQGLVSALGLESKVWARLHTFGKAMSCAGAILLCSSTTREYLINYARSLIYTTALPFTTLASIQTTYSYLMSGKSAPLLEHLWTLVNRTHVLLLSLCERRQPNSKVLYVNPTKPQSPILPVFTSQPRSLAQYCQARGYMIRPIVAPTVPIGKERVRICLHAGNTLDQIEGLVGAIEAWVIDHQNGGTDGNEARQIKPHI
ncbi:hypothetical protein jhhlp_004935 [Lomentospora prolificans]|uniref:Aminotransferase class I/classII large domain-containing protein n=1 Tax=Lomentospora prolificans TaxID=41688 RepID=A0A2N3N7X2_9PEZI|nr:hypothetical protein jhhlp_004935 [Lomentospora prolificans]